METLKQYREQKGVKQLAVAEHLGVSRQTYASYEEDQERMSVGQAKAACAFLGIPIEEIFLAEDVN